MNIRAADPRYKKRAAILVIALLAVYYVESHVGVVFTDAAKATVVWHSDGRS